MSIATGIVSSTILNMRRKVSRKGSKRTAGFYIYHMRVSGCLISRSHSHMINYNKLPNRRTKLLPYGKA